MPHGQLPWCGEESDPGCPGRGMRSPPSTLCVELCWLNPSRRSNTLRICFRREFDSMKALQGSTTHRPGCSPVLGDKELKGGPSVTYLDCCRQCKRKVTLPVVSVRKPKRLRRSPWADSRDTVSLCGLWSRGIAVIRIPVLGKCRVVKETTLVIQTSAPQE